MSKSTPQLALRRLALQLFLILAILAMLPLARFPSHAGAQTSGEGDVRLLPAMSTIPAGDGPFTVYVVLEGLQHAGNVNYDDDRDGTPDRSVPSEGLGAFQFTIEYDPAIVEFQDAERGPNLSETGRSFQCLAALQDIGTVTFGCLSPGASPAGAQGTRTLASVQFSPRSNGLSPLVLSAEIAGPLGDSAEVDVGGGAVRVTGSIQEQPTGTSRPGTPTQTVIAVGTTPPVDATTTARNTIEATGTPGGTPTALVPGRSVTPGPTSVPPGPGDDGGSGSRLWLWSLGIGGGLALAALGLGAILWRRRGRGEY